ncbi:MAG: universal stress protein [Hyphomicrobiaceae bacterium]|nr:universal stress protein [Hyphomicrobiaceae bacterium]
MLKPRRSTAAGHRRKFLVVIDGTPECGRAVLYAARRAERTGGGLVMLYCIVPDEFQHWLGVEAIMRREGEEEGAAVLDEVVNNLHAAAIAIEPERVMRFGKPSEQIVELIGEDEDIAILVLAAGTGNEGPGPLVSMIGSKAGQSFPVPVTIVPGTLSDEDIEAIA